jgi:hypothetical protein
VLEVLPVSPKIWGHNIWYDLPILKQGSYEAPSDEETNLRPTIPDTIKSKQIILMISRDSPNGIMPIITTPTAPIPVHTAHANALPVFHMGFEVLITEKQEGTLF